LEFFVRGGQPQENDKLRELASESLRPDQTAAAGRHVCAPGNSTVHDNEFLTSLNGAVSSAKIA
jgi:hypothetical protein